MPTKREATQFLEFRRVLDRTSTSAHSPDARARDTSAKRYLRVTAFDLVIYAFTVWGQNVLT